MNCGRFFFFGGVSLWFFLFVYEISPELLNGFAPKSHGRRVWSLAWMSLKVKVTRVKNQHLSTLLASCVQFMFGKTSLASSFWATVYERFTLCYRTVVCPVGLSVCNVGVLCQTVGWIKMKLGMQVGLGSGHIVLDGDPAPLPQRGTAPNFRPIFVVAKWLDGSRCHLV